VEQGARFDAVIVNPPRRGVGPVARAWLARLASPLIAYVSCDPDTLARDLDHMSRLGYRCASTQPLDMIPLSDEVETVAVLRRAPPARPRVLYEDETVLFVDKAPHEPTLEHVEHVSSLLGRLRTSTQITEVMALSKLDVGASGVAIFAKSPEHEARWKRALVAASTRTRYRRLAIFAGHCVVRAMPEHGRALQIRRHFASIGHPVLGDDRYGHPSTNRHFEEKYGLDRTFLHCVRVEIDHPETGARLVVESELPGDLASVLERAGGPGTIRTLDQKNALGRNTSSYPPPPSTQQPDSRGASGSDGKLVRADIVSDEDDPRDV
jgi:23S rRNA (uracil1939-C5)-methyltransferase